MRAAVVVLLSLLVGVACVDGGNEVILATTTSTRDSGLLDVLVPEFERETGYEVKTIAVGSGAALRLGGEGEADVLLVHSPEAEEEFMRADGGALRRQVMHNDFVVIGPANDPANVGDGTDAAEAFSGIALSEATFVSRGDSSGTHAKELKLWASAGIDPSGGWYQETGTGMAQTLLVADQKDGYTLTDRGTYLAFRDRLALELLVEGDPMLFNVYHVIAVNPEKSGRINFQGAADFADFITSRRVQEMIARFGEDRFGQPLFVPDAYVESSLDRVPQP